MKKLIRNIVLLAPAFVAMSLTSCDDWLDIEPKTEIIEKNMWQEQADVEAVIASCYGAMSADDVITRMVAYGELRGDNLTFSSIRHDDLSTGDYEMYKSIALSSIIQTDGLTSWAPLYRVINLCNYVIHYAPGVCQLDPDYLPSEMMANVAEARALRALCYFYLIRTFDRVPYSSEPTIDDTRELRIPQVGQEVILPEIKADLEYASRNARSVYPEAQHTKFRITRKAALTMLADVYLWEASAATYPQDSILYERVIQYCDQAYNTDVVSGSVPSGVASFSAYLPWDGRSSYSQIFEGGYSNPNPEVIFALVANRTTHGEQRSSGSNPSNTLIALNKLYGTPSPTIGERGDLATTYLIAPNDKYPRTTPAAANFTALDAPFAVENTSGTGEDKRFAYCAIADAGSSVFFVTKYKRNTYGLGYYPSWIFYRVSDIFLMKAEAMIEKMNARFNYLNAPDGSRSLVYLNYEDEVRNGTTFYSDTLKKAFVLLQAIYNRANDKTTMRTAYSRYGDGSRDIRTMVDLVYAERRREFLFEGKRWFDLLRLARRNNKRDPSTATNVVVNSVRTKLEEGADLIGSRLASMDALYWPVSKSELDRNPNLVQNEYYLSTADADAYER